MNWVCFTCLKEAEDSKDVTSPPGCYLWLLPSLYMSQKMGCVGDYGKVGGCELSSDVRWKNGVGWVGEGCLIVDKSRS